MPVRVESQTVIECDTCLSQFIEPYSRKRVLSEARKNGWKIGKNVVCPDCQKKS